MPYRFERFLAAGGEPGHADHAPLDAGRLRSPPRHAPQRRPHFTRYAEQQDIARQAAQRRYDLGRRLAEQVFKLVFRFNG